jgi:hypothetical protein
MKGFRVKMAEFHYCLTAPNGDDGPIVPYGERAYLEDGEYLYTCLVADSDDQSPEVFRADELTMVESEIDEVIFPEEVIKALSSVSDALEKCAGQDGDDTNTIEATAEKLT